MQLGLVPIVHVFGKLMDHVVQLFTSFNATISVVIIGSENAVCNLVVAFMIVDFLCAFGLSPCCSFALLGTFGLNKVEFIINWI